MLKFDSVYTQRRTKQFYSLDKKFGDAILGTFEATIQELEHDAY